MRRAAGGGEASTRPRRRTLTRGGSSPTWRACNAWCERYDAGVSIGWLGGWDPTPGIVSVWASPDGRVIVWRRVDGALVREDGKFRPWLVAPRRVDDPRVTVRELAGEGALRFVLRADDVRTLTAAVRDLDRELLILLPPEEQYLVQTGRQYFRGLAFDQLRRFQFDLETTGLDADRDRIFMIATRDCDGQVEILEGGDEARLITRLVDKVRAADPDVIENHNLQGFDLPFLFKRAARLGVRLALGRIGDGLTQRAARRGMQVGERRVRFVAPGRELIDTLDAAIRHEFASGRGLKELARSLGIAGEERELIRGDRIHAVYLEDPARVRRYATADVEEAAQLARVLGGAAFALATLVPRRYERLADAGAATGVLDPLLVRAYLKNGAALPLHAQGDGTPHQGAALHLFHAGVAHRVVKADVASLYPSLMRAYQIGPASDRLGALLEIVDQLVVDRLAAKAAAKRATDPAERHTHEAMSAAMKLVVNSAYGYLGAPGLTRFADVHAANEVTRRGRELLDLMCAELAARGAVLLEADTDGVYFAVPESWTELDERRVVAEVGALLPELVTLEFEGRYAAMLSHEPKNYALLGYDGALTLRGVAFRSSRTEPFGEAFLRAAVGALLHGDIAAVHAIYMATIAALRGRGVSTHDVSSRVKLTKSPEEYLATRESRREASYEAVVGAGRSWSVGERVRVYRAQSGPALLDEDRDPRDYDIEHYVRLLREQFATRFAHAFSGDDHAALFGDPDQLSLFARAPSAIRPVLTKTGTHHNLSTDGSL